MIGWNDFIWFALGAFAAMISALLGAPLWLQITWFAVVSLASLWFTRPFVKKFVNGRVQPTNADVVIGKDAVVTEAMLAPIINLFLLQRKR